MDARSFSFDEDEFSVAMTTKFIIESDDEGRLFFSIITVIGGVPMRTEVEITEGEVPEIIKALETFLASKGA